MSLPAAALRILLSLALVVDAMGAATAALRMPAMPAVAAAPAAAAQAHTDHRADMELCLRHPSAPAARAIDADAASRMQANRAAPDCCTASACHCPCAPAYAAIPMRLTRVLAIPARAPRVAETAAAIRPLALPLALRPPIV